MVFSFNRDKIGNHAFVDLNAANSDRTHKNLFALGTKQGDMSRHFNTFTISNLCEGEWVGEDGAVYDYTVYPRYSVKTIKTTVVLEIELSELKRHLNSQ